MYILYLPTAYLFSSEFSIPLPVNIPILFNGTAIVVCFAFQSPQITFLDYSSLLTSARYCICIIPVCQPVPGIAKFRLSTKSYTHCRSLLHCIVDIDNPA